MAGAAIIVFLIDTFIYSINNILLYSLMLLVCILMVLYMLINKKSLRHFSI